MFPDFAAPFAQLERTLSDATGQPVNDCLDLPVEEFRIRERRIEQFITTQATLMSTFETDNVTSIATTVNALNPALPNKLQVPTRSHKAVNKPLAGTASQATVVNRDVLELASSYPANEVTVIQNPGHPTFLPGGYYGMGDNAFGEQLCFQSDLAFRLAPAGSGYEYCNRFIQSYIQDMFDAGVKNVDVIAQNFFKQLDPTESPKKNAQRWFKVFQLAALHTAPLSADYFPPYLRNVAFVMPDNSIRFFDVATSFAPDLKNLIWLDNDIHENTKEQYRTLYQNADAEGADHICAVALGCGALNNAPKIVAGAIKEVPKPNASIAFSIHEIDVPPSQLGSIGKVFDDTLIHRPKRIPLSSTKTPVLDNSKKPTRKPNRLTLSLGIIAVLSFMLGVAILATGVTLTMTGIFSPIGAIASLMGTALIMTPSALLLSNIAIWSALAITVSMSNFIVAGSLIYAGKKGVDLYKGKQTMYPDEILLSEFNSTDDTPFGLGSKVSYTDVLNNAQTINPTDINDIPYNNNPSKS